jgi:hypothetical protein
MVDSEEQQRLLAVAERLSADPDNVRMTASLLAEAKRLLGPAPFRAVVCGEFNMGKSHLLSAMVSKPHIFPHHPNATTAVITTLAWGPQAAARVVRSSDGTSVYGAGAPSLTPEQVQRYITAQAGPAPVADEAGQVVLVEMSAAVERLRSGVVLVDTPGLDSTEPLHDVLTRQFLGKADVVLFTTAAGSPLSVPQLRALRTAVGRGRLPVIVVTKKDLVDAQPFADAARERVARELDVPAGALEVILTSARLARAADREHSVPDRADSGVDLVWDAIERRHRRWVAARTTAAAKCLLTAVETIMVPLRGRQNDEGLIVGQLRELVALRREAVTAVPSETAEAIEKVRANVRERFAALRSAVTDQTQLFASFVDPETYIKHFLEVLTEIREQTDQALDEVHDELVAHWADRAQFIIELDPGSPRPGGGRGSFDTADLLRNAGRPPSLTIGSLREAAGAGKMLAVAGGGLGTIIGGLIGGAIAPGIGMGVGALLGQFVGWVAGLRDELGKARKTWREEQVNELTSKAPDWVTHFAGQEEAWLTRSGETLATNLRDLVEAGLYEQAATLQQILQDRGADPATVRRDAERLSALTAEAAMLRQYDKETS